LVVDDKAWYRSLTALVRQLYHSSKASVKTYQRRVLSDKIPGSGGSKGYRRETR